jgi:hypothetical protein
MQDKIIAGLIHACELMVFLNIYYFVLYLLGIIALLSPTVKILLFAGLILWVFIDSVRFARNSD